MTATLREKDPAFGLRTAQGVAPEHAALCLGGDPNLPDALDWPIDAGGLPMHHLLQIDCAALPAIDPDFPETGTLFFFVTGSWAPRDAPSLGYDAGASAILYWPEPVTGLPPRAHPADTPQLGDRSIAETPVQDDRAAAAAKPGLLSRLLGRDAPRPSPRQFTKTLTPVALEAVRFDSHPQADPAITYQALGRDGSGRDPSDYGFRPQQILGYAPRLDDVAALDLQGYLEASEDKTLAAYARAEARRGDDEPVLLLQLASQEDWNLDLISYEYALQVRIKRQDLRARRFEAHWTVQEKLKLSGRLFVPQPTPELAFPDASAMRPAIALKPLVPGEDAQVTSNAFCGLPQLPDGLDWPRRADGMPLHHLMQLDCATIPRSHEGHALPDLPDQGTLFVFVDAHSYDLGGDSLQVLYTETAVQPLPPRAAPEDLAVLNPGEEGLSLGVFDPHRMPEALADLPTPSDARAYEPRLPFAPVPYLTFPLEGYEAAAEAAQLETRKAALPHEPGAIPDATWVIDWLPNWWPQFCKARGDGTMRAGRMDAPVRRIPDSYPWFWANIQDSVIQLFTATERIEGVERTALSTLWPEDIEAEARAWFERAAPHHPMTALDDKTAIAFRDWLKRVDAGAANIGEETDGEPSATRRERLDRFYAYKAVLSALALPSLRSVMHWYLHEDGALPPEVRAVAADHLRFERSHTRLAAHNVVHEPMPHQLFPPVNGNRDAQDEVVLFQFASGYGLRAQWGDCCALQIRISNADLAARRFERCRGEILW